jgi:hypothetical protein
MARPGQFRAAIEEARIRGEAPAIVAAPHAAVTETASVEAALHETKRERRQRLKEELREAEWRARHAH